MGLREPTLYENDTKTNILPLDVGCVPTDASEKTCANRSAMRVCTHIGEPNLAIFPRARVAPFSPMFSARRGGLIAPTRPKLDHSTLDLNEEGHSRPRTADGDGDGDRHTCSWHGAMRRDATRPVGYYTPFAEQSERVLLDARRSRRPTGQSVSG